MLDVNWDLSCFLTDLLINLFIRHFLFKFRNSIASVQSKIVQQEQHEQSQLGFTFYDFNQQSKNNCLNISSIFIYVYLKQLIVFF